MLPSKRRHDLLTAGAEVEPPAVGRKRAGHGNASIQTDAIWGCKTTHGASRIVRVRLDRSGVDEGACPR